MQAWKGFLNLLIKIYVLKVYHVLIASFQYARYLEEHFTNLKKAGMENAEVIVLQVADAYNA